jgi:hypothetical protein
MGGTNLTQNKSQTQIQNTLSYMARLNFQNLIKLVNDPIYHNTIYPAMSTNIPFDIPKL